MAIEVAAVDAAQVPELAEVAAITFPLACPPSVSRENVIAFIEENLSEANFLAYLADGDYALLGAREDGRMVGYAMLIRGIPDDVELSKLYVLPESHGTGVASALMAAALKRAEELDAKSVWLGVNQKNQRAQRFYAKSGFTVNGTRTFRLGEAIENDYLMVRPV